MSAAEIGGPAGQEFEALVLFADRDSLLLKYTREDSVAPNGYALHLDGLSVDPSLLALYQALDQGPRYAYCGGQRNCSYELVGLRAGDPIGRAQGAEVIVATVDSGAFVDPRSCNDWWQIRLDQDCP